MEENNFRFNNLKSVSYAYFTKSSVNLFFSDPKYNGDDEEKSEKKKYFSPNLTACYDARFGYSKKYPSEK